MSASDQLAIEAQNFRYGFLAAGLHDVLARPMGAPISGDEANQFSAADQFLTDVIEGVQLIAEGAPAAARRHPVEALGRVLDPITAIDRYRKCSGDDLRRLFEGMRDFLTLSVKAGHLTGTEEQKEQAAEVFDALTQSILSFFHRQARSQRDPIA